MMFSLQAHQRTYQQKKFIIDGSGFLFLQLYEMPIAITQHEANKCSSRACSSPTIILSRTFVELPYNMLCQSIYAMSYAYIYAIHIMHMSL